MFSSPRIITAVPVLLVLFGLSACGQKGPLFLAPQSVPYKLVPSSPASAPVASPMPATPASTAK